MLCLTWRNNSSQRKHHPGPVKIVLLLGPFNDAYMQPIVFMPIIPLQHLPGLKGETGHYLYPIFADIPDCTGGLTSLEFRPMHGQDGKVKWSPVGHSLVPAFFLMALHTASFQRNNSANY